MCCNVTEFHFVDSTYFTAWLLMFFYSLVFLRQSQQRSLTRHSSSHPVVSYCCAFFYVVFSDCHHIFQCFFLKHETPLFFWDLCFLSTSLIFLVFIFSHMRLLNRLSIARFHVPGHVKGLIAIFTHAFHDILVFLTMMILYRVSWNK